MNIRTNGNGTVREWYGTVDERTGTERYGGRTDERERYGTVDGRVR